jgi:methionyl-tRNA synthetase
LANDLGNLVSRTIAMVEKYFGGVIPDVRKNSEFDESLIELSLTTKKAVEDYLDNLQFSNALSELWKLVSRTNKYIDETAPWKLAKNIDDLPALAGVMYNLCESIRIISILLAPFMPATSPKIREQVGFGEEIANWDDAGKWGLLPGGFKVKKGDIIFPRIDLAKEIESLDAQTKTPQQQEKEAPVGLAQIGIEDFAKVELRVAQIITCEPVKKAKKLLCLTLDDGSGIQRTVASGIAAWYKPEDLIGKKVVLVVNLKPVVLCGVESQGMILAADCAENDVKVVFVDNMPAGAKIR